MKTCTWEKINLFPGFERSTCPLNILKNNSLILVSITGYWSLLIKFNPSFYQVRVLFSLRFFFCFSFCQPAWYLYQRTSLPVCVIGSTGQNRSNKNNIVPSNRPTSSWKNRFVPIFGTKFFPIVGTKPLQTYSSRVWTSPNTLRAQMKNEWIEIL